MFLFFKRKSIAEKKLTQKMSLYQNAFDVFKSKLVFSLQSFAIELQKSSEQLSVAAKKLLLILFCLTGIGLSGYLVVENIFNRGQVKPFSFQPIPLPQLYNDKSDKIKANLISKEEYEKIERLKQLLTGVSRTSSGKNLKDSILKSRPGLFDSLTQFEKIFQLQEQNKK